MTTSRPNEEQLPIYGMAVLFVTASVILFACSLPQDGFYTRQLGRADACGPCWGLLLFGWLGVFTGIPAWLANPAIFWSWLLIWFRRTRGVSLACAVAALCFSLSFMLHDEFLANEAGGRTHITGYATGYWLWNASIGLMVLGALIVYVFTISDAPAQSQSRKPLKKPVLADLD